MNLMPTRLIFEQINEIKKKLNLFSFSIKLVKGLSCIKFVLFRSVPHIAYIILYPYWVCYGKGHQVIFLTESLKDS